MIWPICPPVMLPMETSPPSSTMIFSLLAGLCPSEDDRIDRPPLVTVRFELRHRRRARPGDLDRYTSPSESVKVNTEAGAMEFERLDQRGLAAGPRMGGLREAAARVRRSRHLPKVPVIVRVRMAAEAGNFHGGETS